VLTIASRPLTGAEQAALGSRRARVFERMAADSQRTRQISIEAARVILVLPIAFGLLALFNVYVEHFDTALIAGAATIAFAGLAAWLRFSLFGPSVLDERELERIGAALERAEAWVIEIEADAAIVVRDVEAEPLGDLLRSETDEVIYVSRSLCGSLEPAQLPNAALRIIVVPPLGVFEVETFAARLCPVAELELVGDGQDALAWRDASALQVWTPSVDAFACLDIAAAELTPAYPDPDFVAQVHRLWQHSRP
jgi:hypothetical protein